MSSLLLIACGNSLRRDDGAGLLLAEIIEREWQSKGIEVQRITVQQLLPDWIRTAHANKHRQ